MRAVTRYLSDDDMLWTTEDQAWARDALIASCERVRLLLPRPAILDKPATEGYWQWSADEVRAFKTALLPLVRETLRDWKQADDITVEHMTSGSIVGRYLDDSTDSKHPVRRLWWRVMCIDEQNREWEQPYFVLNPARGKQIPLNPS